MIHRPRIRQENRVPLVVRGQSTGPIAGQTRSGLPGSAEASPSNRSIFHIMNAKMAVTLLRTPASLVQASSIPTTMPGPVN